MTRAAFGGHLDLASSLERIDFSAGAGEMRSAIAYIRRWQRGNTAQVSSSSIITDTFSITNTWGEVETSLQRLFNVGFTPESFSLPPSFYDSSRFIEYSKLSPIVSNPEELFTLPVQSSESGTDGSSSIGTLKSANPQSFFRRFFSTAIQRRPAPVAYSGIAGGSRVTAYGGSTGQLTAGQTPIDVTTDGIWQFLFNPSELEIALGPEYRTSETWGVSGNENSGQPLHWSHNKNATIKFNSVILNGYVFGRRVEELEQGLVALFMARDGLAQEGPIILEFVWGKKIFGPCVIKDITIKEKAWDEGLVVNAEVSFTLERIPEWTINDGYADIARPGAQPLVNEPLTRTTGNTSGGAGATPGGANTSANGGTGATTGTSSGRTTSQPTGVSICRSYNADACRRIVQLRNNLLQLSNNITEARLESTYRINPYTYQVIEPDPPEINRIKRQRLEQLSSQYRQLYTQADAALGSCFTSEAGASSPDKVSAILNDRGSDIEYQFSVLQLAVRDSASALFTVHQLSNCSTKGVPI